MVLESPGLGGITLDADDVSTSVLSDALRTFGQSELAPGGLTGNYTFSTVNSAFDGIAARALRFFVIYGPGNTTTGTLFFRDSNAGDCYLEATLPGLYAKYKGKFAINSAPGAPGITDISPSSGGPGSRVTIRGSGFTGTERVTFGGVPATQISVISDYTLDVTVPSGAASGPVVVRNGKGEFAAPSRSFTVGGGGIVLVRITSPGNGATFPAPASLTIRVEVSVPSEQISTMTLYRNGSAVVISYAPISEYDFSQNDFGPGTLTFMVSVKLVNGTIVNSAPITITVNRQPPSAPVANSATNMSSTSFNANWNSVSVASGYRLDVSTSSTFNSYVPGYQDLDVGNLLARNVNNLSPGTTYYYRVRAYNATGISPNSGTISVTTGAGTSAPSAPAASSATGVNSTGFTANWSGVTGATAGYRIDVSTTRTFSSFVSGYQDLPVLGALERNVNGLSPGTTYYYRVRAANGAGVSANSATVAVTTSIGIPSTAAATSVINSGFTANWIAVSGATGYRLDVSANSSFSSYVSGYQNLDVGNALSQNVTALSASTTYHYRVRAYNSFGSSGNSGTVTVITTGQIVAWGRNDFGQTAAPFGLNGVVSIAAGGLHTVALKNDGTVVAWGRNDNGQAAVPTGLSGVIAIAAGSGHTVALKSNGTIVAWGAGGEYSYGQTKVPVNLGRITAIAAGAYHTVALKADGTVVAWGADGVWSQPGQTKAPANLSGVTAIAAGAWHNVALKNDGTIVAWGDNGSGQTNAPSGLGQVKSIAAGDLHTVVLKSDGTIAAWGSNRFGESTVPPGLSGIIAIDAAGYHTVALKNDGTVVVWGWNDWGQTNAPAGLRGVTAIAAAQHIVALVGTAESVAPSAPGAHPASSTNRGGFMASWSSVSGATGYRLDVSTSSTFSSYITGYQNLDVGNVLSRAVTGLSAGTTYYYRVRAYNSAGPGLDSGIITVTTSTGATVPAAPIVNSAFSVTSSGFMASWNGVSGATGYRLDLSTSSSFSSYVSGYQSLDVGNILIQTVSGLSAGTTYYFRVRAYNGAGISDNSPPKTVTTTAATQTLPPGTGWVLNPANGHYYKVINEANWKNAQAAAVALGANLATIRNAAENAWLVSQFGNVTRWIGLTDEAKEGTWRWVSGEPATFTKWFSGEPNNRSVEIGSNGEEDCVVINWGSPGDWNDTWVTIARATSGLIEWIPPAGQPGLQSAEISVTPTTSADNVAEEGKAIQIRAVIKNGGQARAVATRTRLWLSPKNDWDTSDDFRVDALAIVPALAVGESATSQWDLTMPNLGSGTYDYWVLVELDVDALVAESDESNFWKANNSFKARDPVVGAAVKGDLDRDGSSDIIFQDAGGFLAAWFTDGTNRLSATFLTPDKVSDSNYKVVASGDFDNDGKEDLVLQHSDGTIAVWYMDGVKLTSGVLLNPSNPGDRNWRVVAAGDFNKDGKVDLIFQHIDGTLAVWFLDGARRLSAALFNPPNPGDSRWQVAGVADFSADGNLDLVFQHADGSLAIWYLNGVTQIQSSLTIPQNTGDKQWRVVSVSDRNKDGKSDLLFQHADGSLAIWFMDGVKMSTSRLLNPSKPGGTWKVVAPR